MLDIIGIKRKDAFYNPFSLVAPSDSERTYLPYFIDILYGDMIYPNVSASYYADTNFSLTMALKGKLLLLKWVTNILSIKMDVAINLFSGQWYISRYLILF